ncbi:PQQ-dependent sugar dehydrogenase [Sphingomonas sp. DT-207]|uniref:PQQ-dependent sugar dehydrogenase n=1 Tax=Sphingomonas sp. DT-207 TaxID=3396167 RepID=UPI003F1C107A
MIAFSIIRRQRSKGGGAAGANTFFVTAKAFAVALVVVTQGSLSSCSAAEPTSGQAEIAATGAAPTGTPAEVITGLDVPWSIVLVGDEALVSERDGMEILAFRPGERPRSLGTVPNVATPVDGGVLGLAALEKEGKVWIYAFHSTTSDNRIVRMAYANGALGDPEIVFTAIPVGRGHNGGRIAFGPDKMLYVATGETRNPALSQDPQSLAGKILRITPDGKVPDDNPIKGSAVYSIGHRNPQGLAWDTKGQLWATEFGDKGWDELNRIGPGKNYGWPAVERRAGNPAYVDPVVQWRTTEMGPSGLAYINGTFFIAGLTGQRLWSVVVDDAGRSITKAHYAGTYGRIRDVVAGSNGNLWFVTNNTDGRGDTPKPTDDRILSVQIAPARP